MNPSMIELPAALAAWGSPAFTAVLKEELARVDPAALPLQEGLVRGSHVSGAFQPMIITVSDEGEAVRVRAGIHYQSIIAGCACADDPTPVDEMAEYCEVGITLDKSSARAQVALVGD